ncbi:AzlC family ABC transporter permease [Bacillus marinisedimentorum]|uniref:AzlC family ABC transporter permease n=1 Tax=Bacillus marinisedimentorum TaxID=1821260 RepID=UPI000872ECCC|nr:AzlC family ABC transporter permease [Bacillus marinisedimentorum]
METTAKMGTHGDFLAGAKAGTSIALGYMPIALTFGLFAKSTGLSLWETTAMSIFVFAGAAQYISLNLIAAGTGMAEIILTTFIVNIRHFLMSASLAEKMEDDHPLKKLFYSFGITDETFSVGAMWEGKLSSASLFGIIASSYSSWVIFSAAGHLAGASLPQVLQESMGIALYAMFIGLLVPPLKKHRKVLVLAVTAAVFSIALHLVLSTGWAIVGATLASSILVEVFYPPELKNDELGE